MGTLVPNTVTLENLIDDDSDINAFNDGVKTQEVSPRTTSPQLVVVQIADDPLAPVVVQSGVTDGTTANKLVDSTEDFVTATPVEVGYAVYNETDDTWALVTAVDDLNTLSLSADIMITGETYTIREASYWEQKFGGGEWKRSGTKYGDNPLVAYALPVDTNSVNVHQIVYPWELTDIANYPTK